MEELRAGFNATEDFNTPEDANTPEDNDASEKDNVPGDDENEARLVAFSDGFTANGDYISAVEADDWDMHEDMGNAAHDTEIPIGPALEATARLPDEQMEWDSVGVEWVDRDPFFGAQEAEVDVDVMEIDSLPSGTASHSMVPVTPTQDEEDGAGELVDNEFLESCTMMVENTDQDGQVTIK